MASARKIAANWANAQKSTGPKSGHGKARSARNALRHGLSLSVSADPSLAKEVQAVAFELAGADAPIDVLQYALLVAEAQIDLNRIRRARHNLLRQHGAHPTGADERVETSPVCKNSQAPEKTEGFQESSVSENSRGRRRQVKRVDPAVLDQLVRIARYERRALSKRKSAIRKFDRARQSQAQKPQPNEAAS